MRSFLASVVLLPCALDAIAAEPAEYAVRWSPAQGGPTDAQQVLGTLKIAEAVGPATFSVRYFSVNLPAHAPAAASAVVRERVESGKTETTWKYRWATVPEPSALAAVTCPLTGQTKSKFEVDVSILDGGKVRRAYSWSCEAKSAVSIAVPASLAPTKKGCSSQMLRWQTKSEALKIEQWHLSDGQALMEVSWTAKDGKKNLTQFERQTLAPLLASGVHALDRTKAEIGTQCGS